MNLQEKYALLERAVVLAHYCPTLYPVRIKFVSKLKWWADTHIDRKTFIIRLSNELDYDSAVEVLLHEWSHAMSWFQTKLDHGDKWGIAYAKCWRIIMEDIKPKGKRVRRHDSRHN